MKWTTLTSGTICSAVRRSWRRVRWFGLRYNCVLCRSWLRDFLPHGQPRRPKSICPVCFSRERHRLAWLYLQPLLRTRGPRPRILHLAPEASIAVRLRSTPGVAYIAGDIKACDGIRFDVQFLPFPDRCFDLIYCSHVLNMVENDIVAMHEIVRVLRDDGVAVVQIPLAPCSQTVSATPLWDGALRKTVFGDEFMWHRHGADIVARFAQSGMTISRVAYARTLAHEVFRRSGLIDEDFLLCRRQETPPTDNVRTTPEQSS